MAGDLLEIKPEWQDPGDQDFNFFAAETQLKGMRSIRMRAVHKETGKPIIGLQDIQCDMIASHKPATFEIKPDQARSSKAKSTISIHPIPR